MEIIETNHLRIGKNDLIKILSAGDGNFVIEIKDKSDRFRISFADEETLDYFIEKIRNAFKNVRPLLRKRLYDTRLQVLDLKKELRQRI